MLTGFQQCYYVSKSEESSGIVKAVSYPWDVVDSKGTWRCSDIGCALQGLKEMLPGSSQLMSCWLRFHKLWQASPTTQMRLLTKVCRLNLPSRQACIELSFVFRVIAAV